MRKRIVSILMICCMLFVAACGKTEEANTPTTTGQILQQDFKSLVEAQSDISAEEVAQKLLSSEIIEFAPMTMTVEEGFLTGFGNIEITGFQEGVMFGPMIGTIPFVGYVFTLSEGTDAESFVSMLKENADLRWNICTEADEMVADYVGQKVFFIMCPEQMTEDAVQ